MARANRHFIPGYIWHLTHRCHKREFLFRFSRDRSRWIQLLYKARKRYGLSILNFIVTCNHIHLIAIDNGNPKAIPSTMQYVAGRTGQKYNQLLATCCAADYVRIWSTETLKPLTPPLLREEHFIAAAFSHGNSMLATGSSEGRLRIWDVQSGLDVISPIELGRVIELLRFSDDKNWLEILAEEQPFVLAIAPDDRNLGVLKLWAEVVAGMHIDESKGVYALNKDELKDRWMKLKATGGLD